MTSGASPIPVISLVGRPNVGKSTLFNRLTRSRDAIVADVPGLTRDRHYGQGRIGSAKFIVIDTGGFEPVAKTGITAQMAKQTRQAVLESDLVIFVVDGRDGLTPHDQTIADELRRSRASITVVVNKTEGMRRELVTAEFHALGLGEPIAISSAHGEGVRELMSYLVPEPPEVASEEEPEVTKPVIEGEEATSPVKNHRIKLAVIGRPNVGKSTLCNTLLGEERMIAFDLPGTTRDSVSADFEKAGKLYTLIDTAGIRRRGKVSDTVEKFSVVKTLQSIEDCNVAILMLDAHESVADQDAHIAGYILEAGKALVVAVNKWDGLGTGEKERIKVELMRKLAFMKFASVHFISALEPFGIGALMKSVDQAHAAAFRKLATPKLTRALMAAVERQAPPRRGMTRPKMRYAHQGGHNPPIIIIHGSGLSDIPQAYQRYLEAYFREEFALQGTPLRIEWRSGTNPFVKSETR
jgi:GTPase